jgi:N-acetyl-gamma-glutamyl-phosphate reductase
MTSKLRIAVLGASGYTGADLVRLALTHPNVEITALGRR